MRSKYIRSPSEKDPNLHDLVTQTVKQVQPVKIVISLNLTSVISPPISMERKPFGNWFIVTGEISHGVMASGQPNRVPTVFIVITYMSRGV